LALNHERHAEEVRDGLHEKDHAKAQSRKGKKGTDVAEEQLGLL
jgi:hypothetical protein